MISSNFALVVLFLCGCLWGFTGPALHKHVHFDDPRDFKSKKSKKKSKNNEEEEEDTESDTTIQDDVSVTPNFDDSTTSVKL
jgi:hypothetical protein